MSGSLKGLLRRLAAGSTLKVFYAVRRTGCRCGGRHFPCMMARNFTSFNYKTALGTSVQLQTGFRTSRSLCLCPLIRMTRNFDRLFRRLAADRTLVVTDSVRRTGRCRRRSYLPCML